jgi:muramoyltetrapeptide carboxypeptidase LdcA involved in peptidoglycan recycling
MLRSYGAIGVLSNLEGIVFARAYDYTPEQKKELRKNVIDVVYGEFGCTYPILGNADFGHTDPNFVIPMGVKTRIDVKKKEILFKHQ